MGMGCKDHAYRANMIKPYQLCTCSRAPSLGHTRAYYRWLSSLKVTCMHTIISNQTQHTKHAPHHPCPMLPLRIIRLTTLSFIVLASPEHFQGLLEMAITEPKGHMHALNHH